MKPFSPVPDFIGARTARSADSLAQCLSGISTNSMARMLLPNGKNAPHQALPTRRNLRRIHRRCRRYVLFAPHRDGLVFQVIHLAPSGK